MLQQEVKVDKLLELIGSPPNATITITDLNHFDEIRANIASVKFEGGKLVLDLDDLQSNIGGMRDRVWAPDSGRQSHYEFDLRGFTSVEQGIGIEIVETKGSRNVEFRRGRLPETSAT